MFATLLESRQQRRRQYRYTIMSVTAHAAIIVAGLIAATASAATRPDRDATVPTITYVDIPKPAQASSSPVVRSVPDAGSIPVAPVLDVPAIVIPDFPDASRLPSIDPPARSGLWDHVDHGRPSASTGGGESGITRGVGGAPGGPALDAHQVERTAMLRTRIAPRYPPTLRAAGIEGRVIIRFVVDTSGRAEEASIRILDSSHPQFTDAARAALGRMRFDPARVGGDKVRQLVDLPFTFALTR